jgi:tetratricopeptide (TPR) repeat protein
MLGGLYLIGKAYEEAEQAFAEACSIEPVSSGTYVTIGQDYLSSGMKEKADHYFQQAISRFPDDPKLFVSIGGASWRMNETKQGDVYFKQAMAIRPDDPHLLVDIAAALVVGHHDEAAKYLKKALKLDKELAEIHFYLGSVALLKGDFVKGQKSLNKAKDLARRAGNTLLLERIEGIESTLFLRSFMDRHPGMKGYDGPGRRF